MNRFSIEKIGLLVVCFFSISACSDSQESSTQKNQLAKTASVAQDDSPTAILDPTRSVHYFDVPFPSDDLIQESGTPNLVGYPTSNQVATGPIISWWASEISRLSQGFGVLTPAYFRFSQEINVPTSAIRTFLPFNYKYSNGCYWHRTEVTIKNCSIHQMYLK